MRLNRTSFIVAGIVFFAVVGFWYASYILDNDKKGAVNITESNKGYNITEVLTEETSEEETEIKVYITGEVKNPGVYSAKIGNRVEDVVNMASGFTEEADKESVNMARHIKDAEHIIIKNINDGSSNVSDKENDGENIMIDINTVDADELEKLNGIGDSLSEDIINYRNANGGFKKIEDIKNVSGIGESKFEKIKNNIKVS